VHFHLDADSVAAVAQICRRLDGVPLALELAAARVRHLPVTELAQRLSHPDVILASTDRGADERHRTLRATIAWSYQLLSPPEQRLFRRLSVFRGPFTLEAAEAVCADDSLPAARVFDLVTSLVDKSLVALADTRRSLRYRMLVTIGDFAREQLVEAGETDQVQDSHARYVVDKMASISPVSVEAEPPNVYAELGEMESEAATAFDRLADAHDGARAAVLATRLARLHFFRGTHRDGLDLVQRALALPDAATDESAWLRYREALFHAVMGDPGAAQGPIDEAVRLAERSSDPELPSCVWHVAGDVAFMLDDFQQARHCYLTARGLSRDAELDALLDIRIAELDADGEPSMQVAAAYAAASRHFRDSGDRFNLARCLTGQGSALLRLADAQAVPVLAEAVEVACAVHADADAALAAVLLAAGCAQQQRDDEAAALLGAVASWEQQRGPVVDAMLVAHADDVTALVTDVRAKLAGAASADGDLSLVEVARRSAAFIAAPS
jgi:tetratricopeptide (TPR) repeat protein